MKSMRNVLYCCVLSFAFGACKESEVPVVSIKLDQIAGDVSKDWFIRNVVITTPVNGVDRQLNLLLDCEADDKWTFTRDGKLVVNDNFSKCQGQPVERLNTFWSGDDTFDNLTLLRWRLKEAGEQQNVIFAVSNLSDSTMTLSGGALLNNTKSVVINYRTR